MNPPPTVPPASLRNSGEAPDIREAEQNLRSASARIASRCKFLPTLWFDGAFGKGQPELSSLSGGTADIWRLPPRFSGPVFTGGRLKSEYRAAVDIFDQAKYQYSQSALRAFREVSDALVASQKLSVVEEQQSVKWRLSPIPSPSQGGGILGPCQLLRGPGSAATALPAVNQSFGDFPGSRLAIVQLYRALGGGWNFDNTQ